MLTRVLVLRAGIGTADPLSRRQVSRRLERPLRAVRRLERRGVERLKQAVRSGRCEPATTGASAGGGTEGTAGGAGGGGEPTISTDGPAGIGAGGGVSRDGGGQKVDGRADVKGQSEDNLGPFGVFRSPPAPWDVTLPILLAVMALAVLAFAAWRLRGPTYGTARAGGRFGGALPGWLRRRLP